MLAAILQRPTLAGAVNLLRSAALPVADLTDAHMEHFYFCGSCDAPTALVGFEPACHGVFSIDSLVMRISGKCPDVA